MVHDLSADYLYCLSDILDNMEIILPLCKSIPAHWMTDWFPFCLGSICYYEFLLWHAVFHHMR